MAYMTNLCSEISLPLNSVTLKPWKVDMNYPYNVLPNKELEGSNNNYSKYWCFERRIEAERKSLRLLSGQAIVMGDDTTLESIQYKLNNIEEEHPEWMI